MVLRQTGSIRPSGRYPGFLRIKNSEYRKALLNLITTHASDIVEMMGMEETIRDLKWRLTDVEGACAHDRLTKAILGETGAKDVFKLSAAEFNGAAEKYYRNTLRQEHSAEGLSIIVEIYEKERLDEGEREIVSRFTGGRPASEFLQSLKEDLLAERLDAGKLRQVIGLSIAAIMIKERRFTRGERKKEYVQNATQVC
jgi:hypothetical protein